MKHSRIVTIETNEPKTGHISVTPTRTTTALEAHEITDFPATPTAGRCLMSVKQLARYTDFSEMYWYQRISGKKMPFPVYRFGASVKVRIADVERWIEDHAGARTTRIGNNLRRVMG